MGRLRKGAEIREVVSLRVEPSSRKYLEAVYGSIQVAFDNWLSKEFIAVDAMSLTKAKAEDEEEEQSDAAEYGDAGLTLEDLM